MYRIFERKTHIKMKYFDSGPVDLAPSCRKVLIFQYNVRNAF